VDCFDAIGDPYGGFVSGGWIETLFKDVDT